MGAISQVRTYLKQKFSDTDSDFSEWEDALNFENIPETIIDKNYHIKLGVLSGSVKKDHVVEDNLSGEINVFFRSFRETQSPFNIGYDLVNEFRLRAINTFGIDRGIWKELADVNLSTIEPVFFPSNDNLFVFRMFMDVKLIQKPK